MKLHQVSECISYKLSCSFVSSWISSEELVFQARASQ